MKNYWLQFPSVGPQTIKKLDLIGVTSREELAALGAIGAMQRYLDLTWGWRKWESCSCLAYQFEGILRGCKWYEIPDGVKVALRREVDRMH